MSPRAAFVTLAASLVIGCTATDDGRYYGTTQRRGKPPTTFYANNGAEPEYLDPGKSSDSASSALIYQMFEGLTAFHPEDLRPAQGVAVRFDRSDDSRIFRFYLRPDARWSDGKPVTAHDFDWAWKRVLAPRTASLAASILYPLKNGEIFNLGKLQVARADVALRAEPNGGAPERSRLSKGDAVRILSDSAKGKDGWLRVARHRSLPTFRPATAPREEKTGEPLPYDVGFVAAADLVHDTTVVGVRAVDDLTLEVELERPTPYFLDLTSTVTLAPVRRDVVEAFEQRGAPELWVRPENIVCNGPYLLDEHKFRYEITMKRNPHYWDTGRLKIHRIVFLEVEESHATMNLYKGGDIDFLGNNSSLPSEYMKLLETKKDFQRHTYLSTYWYEFNTKKPPVDDARVRRALNLAVDKKQLVEKITRGGQAPATHYVPDITGLGYSEQVAADRAAGADPFDTPDTRFNPERARELLKEAGHEVVRDGDGWKAPTFPALEILYNTHEGHKQIAVALQDMWKRHLGVSVTLRNEEWKVMLKNMRDGHFQVVRSSWIGDYNHPHTWLDTFLSQSPQNHTSWADPTFDEMLRAAAATPDPRESIRRYREAEKRAVDGMAKLPLYFYTKSTLIKPWVKGFVGNSRNTHLVKWFWIDDDWRNNPTNDFAFAASELPTPGRIASVAP